MTPDNGSATFPESSLSGFPGDALLGKWKQGGESAAVVLVRRYRSRLRALVSARMNRTHRDSADPEDVVQSALASFFAAARESRFAVRDSSHLWRLLVTFAKRKVLRHIERCSAEKRGGGFQRIDLEAGLDQLESGDDSAAAWLSALRSDLPTELRDVVDRMLAGKTQTEIAHELGVTDRTVRRRLIELRRRAGAQAEARFRRLALKQIGYHEFVLGKMIGAGGFGKVYRAALQQDPDRRVAVKFLRKRFWTNDDARQAFLREIEQASTLSHENIVRYLGWGRSPVGGPYLVMEWVDGQPMTRLREGTSDAEFVADLRQVVSALQAVHDAGLVHGDLTPNNLLKDDLGRIRLTDFGFARPFRGASGLPAGGTLGFAAPEQISRDRGEFGPATDIYAVGGLAYWQLTGRAPHTQNGDNALASTLARSDVSTQALTSETSEGEMLVAIARAALRKEVSRRPTLDQLREILSQVS